MGTSVEEPLHESVASLEQAQHPFGENPPKAQPTPGRSGAELWGGEKWRFAACAVVASFRGGGHQELETSQRPGGAGAVRGVTSSGWHVHPRQRGPR